MPCASSLAEKGPRSIPLSRVKEEQNDQDLHEAASSRPHYRSCSSCPLYPLKRQRSNRAAPAAAPAAAAPAQAASAEQPAPLSADQLQGLVAPIALYPDALVAQVLGASTFPDQVVAANEWLTKNKSLTGENLMKAVDKEPWDPA